MDLAEVMEWLEEHDGTEVLLSEFAERIAEA